MVSSFKEVVALWESPDALAAEIGAGVWAARKWPQRDFIPPERWPSILATPTAKEAGLSADLFAFFAERRARREASAA